MGTPRARIAAKLARQSSLARNPVTTLVPCAMPDNISARCEMDLSPGTSAVPDTLRAGCASNLREVDAILEHGARVGAQHLEQRGALLERRQRLGNRRIADVPFDIDEKHVVPLALAGRTRFDARHIDPMLGQRLEQPEQRA